MSQMFLGLGQIGYIRGRHGWGSRRNGPAGTQAEGFLAVGEECVADRGAEQSATRSRGGVDSLAGFELPVRDEMPTLNLASSGPIPRAWLETQNRWQRSAVEIPGAKRKRVNLENLLCHCPDCGAPMTVRLWLRLADCWQCGTSIALEELLQRAQARRLPQPSHRVDSRVDLPAARRQPASRVAPSRAPNEPSARWRMPVSHPASLHETPRERHARRLPTRIATPAEVAGHPTEGVSPYRRSDAWSLQDVPAWLVSLLLHLLLLIALGLFTLSPQRNVEQITLSTTVAADDSLGGRVDLPADDDEPSFDLPIPEESEWEDPQRREELIAADQDARELREDVDADMPHRSSLREVYRALQDPRIESTLMARDPRVRVDVVRQEGGTTLTEAAVARGLRWLSKHQHPEGRWSLSHFAHHPDCQGRCDDPADISSDAAATSLALLPFLGAGQTHQQGLYRDVVRRGLNWLIVHQSPDGDLRYDSPQQAGMYAHGQAAIVLCEAYAMTRDAELREPAQLAIDFIVDAQHRQGGWRYYPGQRGDTSVLGWQLMALQSARVAGLNVPPQTLDRTAAYLDSVMSRDQIRYSYQAGRRPTSVMTAEALLCRMYLGWNAANPRIEEGLTWMLYEHPPSRRETDIYYWYYATQTFHHAGGTLWDDWNVQMREILVESQRRHGHEAGSWDPRGPHANAGGRIYMTALAICTLEVYYRHAPIFRPLGHARF